MYKGMSLHLKYSDSMIDAKEQGCQMFSLKGQIQQVTQSFMKTTRPCYGSIKATKDNT